MVTTTRLRVWCGRLFSYLYLWHVCVVCQILHSGREQCAIVCVVCLCTVFLFCCWCISTSHLRTLRCFQIWPINPIVCGEP